MGTVKTAAPVRPSIAALKAACERPDWEQVFANGGPPCFHIDEDGRFCLRAERWGGHHHPSNPSIHPFVSLFDLVTASSWGGKRPGAGPKPKVDVVAINELRRRRKTWDEVAAILKISRWTAMRALGRAKKVGAL